MYYSLKSKDLKCGRNGKFDRDLAGEVLVMNAGVRAGVWRGK